jgi:hypothetical protein
MPRSIFACGYDYLLCPESAALPTYGIYQGYGYYRTTVTPAFNLVALGCGNLFVYRASLCATRGWHILNLSL